MSEEKGYQGWTNKATWLVALQINNNKLWRGRVYTLVRQRNMRAAQADDALREFVESLTCDWLDGHGDNVATLRVCDGALPSTEITERVLFLHALASHFLADVNWRELRLTWMKP